MTRQVSKCCNLNLKCAGGRDCDALSTILFTTILAHFPRSPKNRLYFALRFRISFGHCLYAKTRPKDIVYIRVLQLISPEENYRPSNGLGMEFRLRVNILFPGSHFARRHKVVSINPFVIGAGYSVPKKKQCRCDQYSQSVFADPFHWRRCINLST
jgi:hypothetical protein